MDIEFEESDCEEMADLNLAGSAVQAYMFEPTKGTEGEKSASGSEEDSDSDKLEMSVVTWILCKRILRGRTNWTCLPLVSFQLFYISKQRACSN